MDEPIADKSPRSPHSIVDRLMMVLLAIAAIVTAAFLWLGKTVPGAR